MNEFVIITPEFSNGGGVGDYTLRLLENWPRLENLTLLVAKGLGESAQRNYQVRQLGSDRAAILKQLPAGGGKILLQYSAYGFDRLGYPRDLIRALLEWKEHARGRLVVMFHEIWAFWPLLNKNFPLQWLHRRAIGRLLESSDAVFTSTPSQGDHLRILAGGMPIRVLPVGSNVRPNEDVKVSRSQGWAALFGRQATRLAALQKMEKRLATLAASGRIRKIISIGRDSDPGACDHERELFDRLKLSEGFEQRGAGTEEQISQVLSSVAFGIFGQDELSLGKSGTFMAYAAHQLNVLAEIADSSKPAPVCWLVAPDELLDGISQDELDIRAERLRLWQKETCSWQRIARELGSALELDPAVG
jgi:hypothetical protein